MKRSFWTARPFGYGDKYPQLDVGQVIEIEVGQQPNDEKLIRLGLLKEVTTKPVQCGRCGALFADSGYLDRHGRNRHSVSELEAGRREAPDADKETAEALGRLKAVEAADEFAERNIPLNLEKTKASQEASRHRASR